MGLEDAACMGSSVVGGFDCLARPTVEPIYPDSIPCGTPALLTSPSSGTTDHTRLAFPLPG